jgi:hypothetical protein
LNSRILFITEKNNMICIFKWLYNNEQNYLISHDQILKIKNIEIKEIFGE